MSSQKSFGDFKTADELKEKNKIKFKDRKRSREER